MPWTDGHLDLAYLAVNGRDLLSRCDSAVGCVDLPALKAARVDLVFATIFTEPGLTGGEPHGYARDDAADAEAAGMRQLQVYEQLHARRELFIVRDATDLSRQTALPKAVLLMEGADPIRSPHNVREWFDRGLRIVGLTWATGTRYAGGNSDHGPLTSAGRELIAALDDCGIIHDASHLSDAAFNALMSCAKGPVIASHSNCRALLNDSQRHLCDDQIKAIGERGGVIGLNLYSKFLAPGRRATIDDCLRHIERVCEIMGHRRGVGLGSDMDGGFGPGDLPEGLDHPSKLDVLAAALRERGWANDEIAGFQDANWRNFLTSRWRSVLTSGDS